MMFEGPVFSIGIPANDNPVRVHHVDWSGRAAREALRLDTSEFLFNEGTKWSPDLLTHHATRENHSLDDATYEAGGSVRPNVWSRVVEAGASSALSAATTYRQLEIHVARGLTFVGIGIGLDHLLFSGSGIALADGAYADSPSESPQHIPAGSGIDPSNSTLDDHSFEPAQEVAAPQASQTVVGEVRAVARAGIEDVHGEDMPAFAVHRQSSLAATGSAFVDDGHRGTAALPAASAASLPIANSPGLRLQGTAGDDVLIGADGDDVLIGAEGADTLVGLAGDDVLDGGGGADVLLGGAGDDVLDGGEDADLMLGGSGDDTYVVDDAGDVVVEFDDDGTDTVATTLLEYRLADNVENLRFVGSGNFTGHGNAGNNYIVSDDGDDRLFGDDASDEEAPFGFDRSGAAAQGLSSTAELTEAALAEIIGPQAPPFVFDTFTTSTIVSSLGQSFAQLQGTGANELLLGHSNQNDAIFGAKGNDAISGGLGLGQDTLDGGQGNDTLEGGSGNDYLIGGTGNDTFVFRNGFGIDVIADFGFTGGDHDVIMCSNWNIDGYEALDDRIQQVGGDVIITISAHDQITLQNFQLINLSVHDHFEFA